MKSFSKKQAIILLGGVVVVIIIGLIIFLNLRPNLNPAPPPKIAVWGLEPHDAFSGVVANYPYGTVTYTQLDPANYRAQILAALAAGNGPDVFEIGNRDLPLWQSALAPFLASSTTVSALQLAAQYPDVVTQDFVAGGELYGLPLTLDTLVMVYNKDIFNTAGIATPPATWDQFDGDVPKLRITNAQGQITQAAAAIGGSTASIQNAPDILSLLMLQNGTQMTDAQNIAATFATQSVGIKAFNFYLQFANPTSPYYTWNDGMGNAVDSFVAQKTAVVFLYASDLAALKAKAPYLHFGIAPMPQPTGATIAVNYPKYYGFVAAKAGQTTAAWNFILYLTELSGVGTTYQTAVGAPSALRTDIAADATNPDLAVFAAQALTARSWYEADSAQAEAALNQAITSVLTNAADSTQALTQAQTAISALMR